MDTLANLLWIGIFTGGFCILLALGDLIMDVLYKFVPPYRRWFDEQLKNMPEWEEET